MGDSVPAMPGVVLLKQCAFTGAGSEERHDAIEHAEGVERETRQSSPWGALPGTRKSQTLSIEKRISSNIELISIATCSTIQKNFPPLFAVTPKFPQKNLDKKVSRS